MSLYNVNPVKYNVLGKNLPANDSTIHVVTSKPDNTIQGTADIYIENMGDIQTLDTSIYKVIAPTGPINQWSRIEPRLDNASNTAVSYTGIDNDHNRIAFKFDFAGITGAQSSDYYAVDFDINKDIGISGIDYTTSIIFKMFNVVDFTGLTGAGTNSFYGITGAQGPTGQKGVDAVTGMEGPTGSVGSQGQQGATGYSPTGMIGAQGLTGIMAPTGAPGITGPQGIIGPQGQQGSQGLTGANGITGSIGSQGPVGNQGPVGAQGLTGVIAPTGSVGATGNIGPVGQQGAQGLTGYQGITGASSIGSTGPQGAVGSQGQTGSQGTTGVGSTGAIGPQGITGQAGATGTQGTAGTKGVTGAVNFVDSALPFSVIDKPLVLWDNSATRAYLSIPSLGGTNRFVQISAGAQAGATGVRGITGAVNFVDSSLPFTVLDKPLVLWDNTATRAYLSVPSLGGSNRFVQISAGAQAGITGLPGAVGVTGNAGSNGATGAQGFTGVAGTNGTTGIKGLTIDSIAGFVETVKNQTYILEEYAPASYTINSLAIKTVSGTCTANLQINTTSVTSISAVSVTSGRTIATASGANVVNAGDRVNLIVTSNASGTSMSFSISRTW